MKKLKPQNWPLIIARIQKRGLTQTQIQDKTGVDQRTISALKLGRIKDTSYMFGVAIMKLYKEKL